MPSSAPRSGSADAARLAAALLAAAAAGGVHAQDEPLRNWFDDPFFPITSALAGCPEPAGPRITEAERREQSHRRAEKGTTCWLAREPDCERHNAFGYDAAIADAIRAAVARERPFPRSSLWVTVQGRIVFVAGCAMPEVGEAQVEAFMRRLPHVQQAIASLARPGTVARPPYRVLPAR